MQYDRRLAVFGIGDIDVDLTYFNTLVTPVADFGIESHRFARGNYIGESIYYFLSHISLLTIPGKRPYSLYCGPRNSL
jgi:hypothetical protein